MRRVFAWTAVLALLLLAATVHPAETVERLDPHGYIFPIAGLHRAAGHSH